MTVIRVWTNYAKSGDQPPPIVREMDLEQYLRGVVPHEMSPSAPLEALKAQAVAARTFALGTLAPHGQPRHRDTADVCATDHCQAWTAGTSPASDAAVLSTAGQFLKFQDRIASAYYFGHCGGRTNTPADAGWPGSAPWCQPVDCLCQPPRPPFNHGVGMCQDGAVLMAQRGYDYAMILHHYFTGVTLAVAGVDLPPSQMGYDSQYVLMAQSAGPEVWAALSPYAMRFRVTCGFSHDDALRVHGDRHTITILGSAGQEWSVPQELETFLRQVAPSNVTIERVEASTLDELSARLQDCITQGNPLAYR
jgi:hypothetical protein